MTECKDFYIGDSYIADVHHIGIDFNGFRYNVIFGRYVNGGFCCIPNWNVGCELAHPQDILWNEESLYKTLKKKKLAKVIAKAIAEYSKILEE